MASSSVLGSNWNLNPWNYLRVKVVSQFYYINLKIQLNFISASDHVLVSQRQVSHMLVLLTQSLVRHMLFLLVQGLVRHMLVLLAQGLVRHKA